MATDAQNIDQLAARSQEILFEASSFFPFTLFADRITVDRVKVSIIKRFFWQDKITESILHDEIISVSAHLVFFLGNVTITPRLTALRPITIKNLRRDDAQLIRRILQGLSAAREKEIDLDSLDRDTLLARLETIGRAN
jgi:hypothetical protein